jgi:hypothetical protein
MRCQPREMSFPMRRKLQVLQIKQVQYRTCTCTYNIKSTKIIYQKNKFQQKEGSIGTRHGKNQSKQINRMKRQHAEHVFLNVYAEPRNRFQGINSASLCNLAGRYDNPIPTRCLAPIDFLKIPAQDSVETKKKMQFIANGQETCLQARQRLKRHGQETRDRSSKGQIMAN